MQRKLDGNMAHMKWYTALLFKSMAHSLSIEIDNYSASEEILFSLWPIS